MAKIRVRLSDLLVLTGLGFLVLFASGYFIVKYFKERGLRNNNPWNIEHGKNSIGTQDPWAGLAPLRQGDPGWDPRFEQFTEPVWGIRAGMKNALHHYTLGARTIKQLIEILTPRTETGNDTDGYIKSVSLQMNIPADRDLFLDKDPATLVKLAQAVTVRENGRNPYDLATFTKAAELARKNL